MPSSSDVMSRAREPACFGFSWTKASAAITNAAIEDFMSAAPRPYSLPSRMVGTKGSECHSDSGPVGTTSVWPAKQTTGACVPRRAHRLVTSPNFIGSHLKPAAASRLESRSWQPPSSGVIDLRPISSLARSSAFSSGIHVDLDVAERGATARGQDAFLLLLGGRRGGLAAGGRRLAGDLARGRLVDQPQHV